MITRTIKRIWNFILSGFSGRRLQKRMLQGFAALDRIERKGLLTWIREGRYLLLEQPFTTSILATGKKGAKNIFTMVALWQNFHIFLEAAEQIRLETELAAVRKAKKEHPSLTNEDIRRNGQLVALGHFDGKELQMAMYEDVKYNLMRGEDENN